MSNTLAVSRVETCLNLSPAPDQGAELVVLAEVGTGIGYSVPDVYRGIAEPVPIGSGDEPS